MEPQKSSIGGIIGTIIIISLIVLGGLYFWGKRIEESKAKQDLVTDSIPTQTNTTTTETSSSTQNNSIEASLDSTINIEAE